MIFLIIGVGTDIIETARIARCLQKPRFLNFCFTPAEIKYICSAHKLSAQRAAGIFAAKEAVVKACGVGFAAIPPKRVEILRKNSGQPFAVILSGQYSRVKVSLSISHSREYAVAFAVAEG